MGCLGDCFAKILLVIASIVKVLIAIAIIVVVYEKLSNVTYGTVAPYIEQTCVMGNHDGYSLCLYAYVVAGVSIIASGLLSLFLCCTCDLCGLGFIFEFALAVAGTVWWVIAAIIFTTASKKADNDAIPEEQARHVVWILCWVEVAVFAFVVLIHLGQGLSKLCGCCCGGDKN